MRKIPLSMITPDMILAKPIYHNKTLLLSEGTGELQKYISNLATLGIFQIYVEDNVSSGIEIPDAISDKTRFKCKEALSNTIDRLSKEGTVDTTQLSEIILQMIDEILARPDIIISLSDISAIDDRILVHSVNATVYALLLGQQLGYSVTELKNLAEGTILHDIGKTLIDQAILKKPGPLTLEEFENVKQHPELGYQILKKNPFISELSRNIALTHHERLDGSGYPNGLKEKDLHEFSKITAIADVYEALTAERCYRRSLDTYLAVEILIQESKSKLDHTLVALFTRNIAIFPNGSLVRLSDNSFGIIKEQNHNMPYRPIVRVIDVSNDLQEPLYEINLLDKLDITIIEPAVTDIL